MGSERHAQQHTRDRSQQALAVLHRGDAEVATRFQRDPARAVVQVEGKGDRAIAALAASQHGVVTRAQLAAAGLGRGAIDHRIATGRLFRVHRGVYVVGHPGLASLAREAAAVLACGAGAVVSHRSAAHVLTLLPAIDGDVEVTVAGRYCRHRPGVHVHRIAELDPRDVTERHGIPVTTPARTLLDLAAAVPVRQLELALAEALARRLVRPEELRALLARAPGRKGAGVLLALVNGDGEPALTRSEAEERLLGLVRAARLEPPEANVRVGAHEVDFLWRAERLVLEVDGYAFHSSRASFERDRLCDSQLHAAGLRVLRVTWRQIVDDPMMLVARLAQALAAPPRLP